MDSQYAATLDYIYSKLPMFHRVGSSAYKKDLTNITKLCAALDNPQDSFEAIHIGGTNGKGSTSHMVASLLQTHGFKTGLYVSPHYKDFRERIKIASQYIDRKFIVKFIQDIKPLIEEIQPSFFEITVAMAFSYFREKKVDIAVIEVGLGGRLDSTNILMPKTIAITQISFDHQAMLGNTLELIAVEKAGIIKPNVPCIIGETQEEVAHVFRQKAASVNAPILFADRLFSSKIIRENIDSLCVSINKGNKPYLSNLNIPCAGSFQEKNTVTAIHTFETFMENCQMKVDISRVKFGLENFPKLTNFIGRWQVLQHKPLVIADSAHNIAGISMVLNQINKYHFPHIKIILGFVNDKDVTNVLEMLPKKAQYFFVNANIPRALPSSELKSLASYHGLKGKSYTSAKRGKIAAIRSAKENDLILILGSIFVVGECL